MRIEPGRIAVVTGGASGIGYALAAAAAARGMRVVLADVRADALEAAAARLSGEGAAVDGSRRRRLPPDDIERVARAAFGSAASSSSAPTRASSGTAGPGRCPQPTGSG